MQPAPALPSALGEFRLEGILGQGGSGTVYDATWGPRRVALKVLHEHLVGTGKERAQFLAEAQRLQQIGHPSVVKVLAVGQLPDGRPYLAMERLDGETLASVIARGALPLARSIEIFTELASAVGALHDQGLVHRDLKPENVFLVAGKHAVLLDFGIAKDLAAPASTTTQEGNVRGTPAYMAPERFFGQPAGLATDIYELALVLYVMLAGRLPWDEIADPEARLSPRSLVDLARVPEALDVEIRRALSTRMQNRPASAAALSEAIRATATGEVAEPTAAETARMRAGGTSAPEQRDQRGQPGPKGPTGNTPLAWAPTAPAPATAKTGRTRRIRIGVGVGITVAAAAAFATVTIVRTRDDAPRPVVAVVKPAADAAVVPAANDPWATHPVDSTPKALPLVGAKHTAEAYRAEAAASLQHLPADTRFVFEVQIDELRAQSATAALLDKIVKYPKLALFAATLPPCVRAIAGDAEWMVFGAASVATSDRGTLIVRGRWRRKDLEACFDDSAKQHVAKDGATLYRLSDMGWLDFVDDHTAFFSIRDDLEAEALHALVRHGTGIQPHARTLFAALPVAHSIAIVVDGQAGDDWSGLLPLPKGSDVSMWIRIESMGLALDAAAETHDEAAARATVTKIQPQLDEMFTAAHAESFGKLAVVRQKSLVHVRGTMTSLSISMLTSAFAL